MELSSDLPLYESIKRDLQTRIDSGELPEGTRILPEIELAQKLGVSRSTTRKALRALEMEGYISRTAGRGSFVRAAKNDGDVLAAGALGSLGITVFGMERRNHPGLVVQGFMNEAAREGYRTIVHPPRAPETDEFEYLLNVRRTGVDGWALWLMDPTEKNIELLRHFQKSGCALVMIDRYIRSFNTDYVTTKNEELGYRLTRELLKRGHREIGMITFPLDCTVWQERLAGYQRALAEAGVAYREDLLVTDRIQGWEPLRTQILGLLSRRARPTAVFCASEHHAGLLQSELARLQYRIPEDLELAIVDDNGYAEGVEFPVIYATQRSYEMGKVAAAVLHRRIQEPEAAWQQYALDFDLESPPQA